MAKNPQARPIPGMDVLDDTGHFVGTVESIEREHFVVRKGFIFPTDQRIPISAIDEINEKELRLRTSRESALRESAAMIWAHQPECGEILSDTEEE